jgi:hypothetical protein
MKDTLNQSDEVSTELKPLSLVETLISPDGWDDVDTMVFCFYKATLKVAIGEYPIGATFDCVVFNFEEGKLSFYDGNNELSAVNFTLQFEKKEKENGDH